MRGDPYLRPCITISVGPVVLHTDGVTDAMAGGCMISDESYTTEVSPVAVLRRTVPDLAVVAHRSWEWGCFRGRGGKGGKGGHGGHGEGRGGVGGAGWRTRL